MRKIREKLIFMNFGPLLYKIGQNSAAALSGCSSFYSALFELCGRKIGQLATLQPDSNHRGKKKA
jgi:hypothetical protein